MSPLLAQVLVWMVDGTPGPLNAALYSDAIVEGLQRGYLRLGGTLDNATLTVTESGARRAATLRRVRTEPAPPPDFEAS